MNLASVITGIWLPVIAAALVQASFSLSVSMLTLLHSHTLAQKKSPKYLTKLSFSYILGAFLVVAAGLTDLTYLFSRSNWDDYAITWAILSGVAILIGAITLLFYYRHDSKGTRLWLPRRAARYLYSRTKQTSNNFEAFILGGASVVVELFFIIAPLLIAASLMANMTDPSQFIAIMVYTVIATLPLLILFFGHVGGRKIAAIQRWREHNKKFLQIVAGTLLIVLGIYLLTYKILGGI